MKKWIITTSFFFLTIYPLVLCISFYSTGNKEAFSLVDSVIFSFAVMVFYLYLLWTFSTKYRRISTTIFISLSIGMLIFMTLHFNDNYGKVAVSELIEKASVYSIAWALFDIMYILLACCIAIAQAIQINEYRDFFKVIQSPIDVK